jgi:hypothetical protein
MRYVTVSVFSEQRTKYAVVDRQKTKILEVFAGADAEAKAQRKADSLNRAQANGESGNVFFTLFGAVALVGALGVMTTTLLRGPLATVAAVNMASRADSAMEIAGRLAGQEFMAAGVDCDADGFKEPATPDLGPSHALAVAAGGGGIPGTVGGNKMDPWGTPFMFCGWDHGTGTMGCPAGLRTGAAAPAGQIAFAIVSAGPDRTFQTTCGDDPAYVTKAGDDRAFLFDQDAADALGGGGLWSLKSGDDTTATIDKDLEISTAATFGGDVVFSSSASLTLGGSFLLPTDAEIIGCTGPDRGALRFHEATTAIQVCDGAGDWLPVGGRDFLALDDVPDSYGAGGSFVRVNGAADGVQFASAALLDLADTPGDYTGMQGRFLRVDGAGVAFQSSYFGDLADAPGFSVLDAGDVLRVDGAGALAFSSMGFLDLSDTPNAWAAPGFAVVVNAGGDGLEFVSSSLFVGPAGPQGPAGADGADGANGSNGADGTNGDNGWSPVFAVESDGARRVLRVVDWQGGTGTEPATGLYVGAAGLVAAIAAAVDVRGGVGATGPAGADGADGADGAAGVTTFTALTDTPASYAGHGGKTVKVNASGDALEFVTVAAPSPGTLDCTTVVASAAIHATASCGVGYMLTGGGCEHSGTTWAAVMTAAPGGQGGGDFYYNGTTANQYHCGSSAGSGNFKAFARCCRIQ